MNDRDTKPTTRPRSAVGAAREIYQEAVDHCEALYLQAHGEVTEEIEQAEAARELAGREALEALVRYERWLDQRERTAAAEREALAKYEAETKRRRAWADQQLAQLAEALRPGRTKLQAGIHTVKLRHTTAVVTTEEMDPQALPPGWTREVPEQIVPASVALDKAAAKADLLLGYREGEPPCAGWYEVEGHGRVWMEPDRESPRAWKIGDGSPYQWQWHWEAGLTIEPEPGRDILRWKPSPPGVALEHRTHVKVG